MTLEVHRTEVTDLAAVTALLLSAFDSPVNSTFADSRVLRWKYFDPGPQWEGSRSYLMRNGDQIHAHCAVWPLNLNFRDKQITCNCFIDWANGSELPGAGFMLKKKLMKLSETSLVVGGSAETREIIPKLGFLHVGEVASFARVIRPWKQFRSRPSEPLLKGAARLARNASWSLHTNDRPKDWSAVPLQSFPHTLELDAEPPFPVPWRDANYLNYWLRCPAARILAYELFKADARMGYFLLSQVGGQMRIADIRINSSVAEDWRAAYSVASQTAAKHPETCEILAAASTPLAAESLKAIGFRYCGGAPLFLYDPGKRLKGSPPMFWNMVEGDAAYLSDPAYPFVT